MAGKHRKVNITRHPTKRQVSRWKKEKRLSRIIGIVTGVVIVAVLGIIGLWYYSEQIMPYQQTVLKVNDKSYNMDYFIKMLDFYTEGQQSNVVKLYPDVVARGIAQSQAIMEAGAADNITISDEEITKELDNMKLEKNDVGIDIVKARLTTRKYSAANCMPSLSLPVEQVEAQAMLLETKSMADDRRQKLILGDNFSNAATLLSLDAYTQSRKGYLGWVPKGYEDKALSSLKDSALKDVLFKLNVGEISEPIYDANAQKPFGYWVLEVLEKDDTRGIHARGILFSSQEDANTVRERLVNGESWDSLAKQYSQHKSKDTGGDLDWIVPGSDKTQLARILSTLDVKKISPAIRDDGTQTGGGYWIAQVLDKKVRPLDDNIKMSLEQDCLSKWLDGLMKGVKSENLLDQKQKDFAADKVLKSRSQ